MITIHARRQRAFQKLVEPQPLHEFQRQPGTAEPPAVLHADPRVVDLDEPWFGLVFQEQLLLRRGGLRIGRLLDAQPARFVHRPQIGHRPLPRTRFRAIRFDERPIRFALAVTPTIKWSQEHGRYVSGLSQDFFPLHDPHQKKTPPKPIVPPHHQTTYVQKKFQEISNQPISANRWGSWVNSASMNESGAVQLVTSIKMRIFVNCIRHGGESACTGQIGHNSIAYAILGAEAQYANGYRDFDPSRFV
jgi:hypothetical protein